MSETGFRLASDIGGTFTDTVLVDEAARIVATAKVPTTTEQPALGALEGSERVLDGAGVRWPDVAGKIHGTTLATNALIERRGAKLATVTTRGFRDILEIAYERRYSQYAINIVKPDLIVPRENAFTIGGRMDVAGREISPLDEKAVDGLAEQLRGAGIEAVAVCLLHAYANPAHELRLKELLNQKLPDLPVSLSHDVSPEAREFDRLCTTVANAYIQPVMGRYLSELEAGFESKGLSCQILLMTAGGGMTTIGTAARLPIRLVESGPAGGAILAARIAREVGEKNVLSFDMGGTTAKLCLIDDHRPQMARRFEIARAERFIKGSGMPVRIPVIEMIEIGAGGGSIASVDGLGRLQVGPRSAGSTPGPAAFCKGGEDATVTDADIAQGYIDEGRFAEGRLKVDPERARAALATHVGRNLSLDARDAGLAVSEIVDENMAAAGRMHAVESGKDLGQRLMIAFGGNGPLHATRVARRAKVDRILIPRDPGVGSAVGFLFAPVSFEIIRSRYATLETLDIAGLNEFFGAMRAEAETVVRAGAPTGPLEIRKAAFMRYHGQGHEIEIDIPEDNLAESDLDAMRERFEAEYRRQFSRSVPGMTIEILNWGMSVSSEPPPPENYPDRPKRYTVKPERTRNIVCDATGDECEAGVFDRSELAPGSQVAGPALIVEPQTTTLVGSGFEAEVDANGNIWLTRLEGETS